jgi:acylglycerol lipase
MIEGDQVARGKPGTALLVETETMLRLHNGMSIFARAWVPMRPKRVVLCVQGLGGHGGYYQALAGQLAPEGTVVVAPDLRGHGRSEGTRGDIDRFDRYLEDVAAALDWAHACWPDQPLMLLGESMGASIAIQYAASAQDCSSSVPLAGLILLSPVLRPIIHPTAGEVARYIRLLLTAPSRPAMPVTGREELGCRDQAFNDRLRADPLFVRLVSVRFLNSLSRWLKQARSQAAKINLPLLVLQGERDYVAHPAGTANFLRRVATRDTRVVMFPDAYHCLLYDPATPLVVQALTSWLIAHAETC